jgi:hypothetical protein
VATFKTAPDAWICTDPAANPNLQRRVTGTCATGTAIQSIASAGTVSCTNTRIVPFDAVVPSGDAPTIVSVGQLAFKTDCHTGSGASTTRAWFENDGSSAANLNYLYAYSNGTPALHVSGVAIPGASSSAATADFGGGRIEGQFIFAVPGSQEVTINLHALDNGGNCEITGTAESALH